MDETAGLNIDFLMLLCGALGIARAFEGVVGKAGPLEHGVVRLLMIGMVALNATASATHWRHVLYGTLMPLGALYLGKAVGEVANAIRGRTKVDS